MCFPGADAGSLAILHLPSLLRGPSQGGHMLGQNPHSSENIWILMVIYGELMDFNVDLMDINGDLWWINGF